MPSPAPWRTNRPAAQPPAAAAPPPLSPDDPRLPALLLRMARTGQGTNACLAAGALPLPVHFYSPVPDVADLRRRQVWSRRSALPGIDLREAEQLALLRTLGEACADECDWPLAPTADPHQFHLNNNSFSYGCAAALHAMIRTRRPRRVIEVGSGFSSRVISAALGRNAAEGAPAEYTVIDPEPSRTTTTLPGIRRFVQERVELTDPAQFEALGPDDLLFIDSGHTVRIGGDVNFLFLDVLPRLGPGVHVHVHDVCLPYEYPETYCTNPAFRMLWTEAYLLQAFLAFNARFEVSLAMAWLQTEHLAVFRQAFPRWDPEKAPTGSGSFWIRRKP